MTAPPKTKRGGERQISVTRETYDRLTDGLPRTHHGRVRPGALQERLDAIINAALDAEERRSKS